MLPNKQLSEESYANAPPPPTASFTPRFMDFWLMGGASLVIFAVLMSAQLLRNNYSFVSQRFEQVAATFALLSLVCNHPHFLASYRMAYGRGWNFCLKHWVAMIAVPAAMLATYAIAFIDLESPVINAGWIKPFNFVFEKIGVGFRFGNVQNLGSELLGASIWFMYLTVGWHYSKQVFGCMLVYANYDGYRLSALQRKFIKLSVYSVAFYSFCNLSFHWQDYFPASPTFQLYGLALGELGLPPILETLAKLGIVGGIFGFLYFVVFMNFQKTRKLPSANFLVPLLAFYAWWVPLIPQKEFYFMMVPFFHSLQYLPFAYRMELKQLASKPHAEKRFALRFLLLLAIGFAAFEAIPGALDFNLNSSLGNIPLFFTISFVVFINIHHFFLDSVLWRFQDEKMKSAILAVNDPRRLPLPGETVLAPAYFR